MPDSARHSEAAEAELITDPQQVAYKEIVNGLKQFETVEAMVHKHLRSDAPRFRFRPSHLLDLHRPALAGLSKYAGVWRMTEVVIHGSRHQPPEADAVPGAIEELCD